MKAARQQRVDQARRPAADIDDRRVAAGPRPTRSGAAMAADRPATSSPAARPWSGKRSANATLRSEAVSHIEVRLKAHRSASNPTLRIQVNHELGPTVSPASTGNRGRRQRPNPPPANAAFASRHFPSNLTQRLRSGRLGDGQFRLDTRQQACTSGGRRQRLARPDRSIGVSRSTRQGRAALSRSGRQWRAGLSGLQAQAR